MKLTDAAADRVREIMANAGKPVAGLRIGVKNGGCAGMEYTLEWAEDQKPFDEVVEDKGVKILIDAKAMMFLLGTEMDFQTSTHKRKWIFTPEALVSQKRERRKREG